MIPEILVSNLLFLIPHTMKRVQSHKLYNTTHDLNIGMVEHQLSMFINYETSKYQTSFPLYNFTGMVKYFPVESA